MRNAVIIEAVRSPVGKKKGKLSGIRPDDLSALVLQEVVRRAGIDSKEVEEVIMGCVSQVGEQSLNIGRNAALIAGLPLDTCGISVNRQCGSSLTAVNLAAQAIMSGMHDCVIGAGVESMTRVPMGSDAFSGQGSPISPKLGERFSLVPQGLSAEMIAEKWKISRQEIDEFSLKSHQKAGTAIKEGRFKREILPIEVTLEDGTKTIFDTDEGVRYDTSIEKLASLLPSFKSDGVITAGSSSQISDGAGAVLIMSEERAKELGVKPMARFVAMAVAGEDPVIMLTAPIPATKKVLKKAGLKLSDIDVVEINEAFACVPIAWGRELNPDWKTVNPNGGAVALGHPLGGTGAILVTKALHELERTKKKYGLITLCTGGGMAPATIIERMN